MRRARGFSALSQQFNLKVEMTTQEIQDAIAKLIHTEEGGGWQGEEVRSRNAAALAKKITTTLATAGLLKTTDD